MALLKGVPLFLFIYFIVAYIPNYAYYLFTVEIPFLTYIRDGFIDAKETPSMRSRPTIALTKEAIEAAGEQLRLNKELAELDTSLELEVRPGYEEQFRKQNQRLLARVQPATESQPRMRPARAKPSTLAAASGWRARTRPLRSGCRVPGIRRNAAGQVSARHLRRVAPRWWRPSKRCSS